MSEAKDIEIYAGEDAVLQFEMDPEQSVDGWAIEFRLPARPIPAPQSAALTKAAEITDPATGKFKVSLDSGDTEGRDSGKYRYYVWRVDEGMAKVLVTGILAVL